MPDESVFELVWDANCATGEGVTWDASRGLIWFCDSPAARLLAFDPVTGERHRYQLDDTVGSFGICDTGELVVALRHRVVIFNPETRRMRPLAALDGLPEHVRLNDGKVGPDGAFWVGSVDMRPIKEPIAKLYRVDGHGRIEEKLDGLVCSNGLAWSPDGATMYLSDSRAEWIDRWHFDPATGVMSGRVRFAALSADEGRPDGAACDMAGNYWSAGVSAGCLNRFAPDGTLLSRFSVPVPAPTMPCFAPGFVYVTSLWAGLDPDTLRKHPQSGALLRMPTDVIGVPLDKFKLARTEI